MRSRRRWIWISLLAVALLLVAVRIALPTVLLHTVNKKLDEIPDYRGHIEDLDLHLYRGAYRLEGIKLEKSSGKIREPFFAARSVDFSVEWGALLRRSLVAEIDVLGPEVNFVAPPPNAGPKAKKEQGQTSIDAAWTDKVKELAPFDINRFRIREGQVHYIDSHRSPKVDVHLDHLEAEATNLTNADKTGKKLPSEFHATGRAQEHAKLKIEIRMDALAKHPTFDLNAEMTGLKMTSLNEFLKAYAKVDAEAGTFSIYAEAAGEDGAFKGYVKPVMKDLKILEPEKDDGKGFLRFAWEAVVSGVSEVMENQPKAQVASTLPLQGRFSEPEAGIWSSVGSLLRNAFIQALRPSLSNSIDLKDVAGGKPAEGTKPE